MKVVEPTSVRLPKPFQHLPPFRSNPPSEITWDQVSRIQSSARSALKGLPPSKVMDIAEDITSSMEAFYNSCEFLRWMGYKLPAGTTLYSICETGEYPSINDMPYSDAEIVGGYCLERLKDYSAIHIFAVFALMKLDEMAGYYGCFKKNPKRTVDLEIASAMLCEAMEALSLAGAIFKVQQVQANAKEMKKRIAKQAAAGRTQRYAPLKEVVLKKYAAGKYKSPHDAAKSIWEDIQQDRNNYPFCPLSSSRAQLTIYEWIRASIYVKDKAKKTASNR